MDRYNCTKRKREIRVHEILSNGQHLNLYFRKFNSDESGVGVWKIGLCISNTRKEANKWWAGKSIRKIDNKLTGKCGLEGLKKALFYILELCKCLIWDEIQISWNDEKRKRAYKYLLRYGFKEAKHCYYYRNPDYWTHVETCD